MTIAAVDRVVEYVGDGVSLEFAVPFQFLARADLAVFSRDLVGNETPLLLDVDYSVAGGLGATGTVTFGSAPSSAAVVVIRGDLALSQPTAYTPNGIFPAKSHELALDRVTIAAQENDARTRDFGGRALLVPNGEVGQTLPPVGIRANSLLGFDADGRPITRYVEAIVEQVATVRLFSSGEVLASAGALKTGSHIDTTDGDTYIVASASATDHDIVTAGGSKLYIIPMNGRVNISAFGLYPGAGDISPSFLSAWRKVSAMGCVMKLAPGAYAVHLAGETLHADGFWGIEGAGRLATTLDGGGVSNLGRIRFSGTCSIHWEGFTFNNFYQPGFTGNPAVTIDGLVIRDVGVTNVACGPTLGCTVRNVVVEEYYCDGVANPHDPNAGVYGLMIGRDFGSDVANSYTQHTFDLRKIYIKNVDGTGRADQIPTNGLAIRAWGAVVDGFTIENVRAAADGVDCEGFYGKLSYSSVSNGIIKDAGGDEGMFVLKGDEPPYITPTNPGNFTAMRTTVNNVLCLCEDGKSLRGFNIVTNNVDLNNVTVDGITGTAFGWGGQQDGSVCTISNFQIKNCGAQNYLAWNAAGTLIVDKGRASNPVPGAFAAHGIYGLVAYATLTHDAKIIVRDYEIEIPASYAGTGRAVAILLLHQAGVNVDLTVRGLRFDFAHAVAANMKLGIVNEFNVTGTANISASGLRYTSDNFYAIRTLAAATSLVASDWGGKTVINYTSAQTFNESHTGRTISNYGAVAGMTHVLPKAQPGMQIAFHATGNSIVVSAASGETLLGTATIAPNTRRVATAVVAGVWAIG